MASKRQIAANRRNAKKSTGPRTPAGKAVVRFNSIRHGFRIHIDSPPVENCPGLIEIRERLLQVWQPQTSAQRRLVAKAARAEWKLIQWRETQIRLLREAETSGSRCQDRLRTAFALGQARLERNIRDALDKLADRIRPKSPESRPLLDIA